jgi:hypothetical protein
MNKLINCKHHLKFQTLKNIFRKVKFTRNNYCDFFENITLLSARIRQQKVSQKDNFFYHYVRKQE